MVLRLFPNVFDGKALHTQVLLLRDGFDFPPSNAISLESGQPAHVRVIDDESPPPMLLFHILPSSVSVPVCPSALLIPSLQLILTFLHIQSYPSLPSKSPVPFTESPKFLSLSILSSLHYLPTFPSPLFSSPLPSSSSPPFPLLSPSYAIPSSPPIDSSYITPTR